jgi:hypothetical protein
MEPDKTTKPEDRRTEYMALRAEILQSDNICVLMMGYLITAVGFLYSVHFEWLVSFLSFIGICYFTEKRFSIRNIASFIADEVCKDDSGFGWEKYVQKSRQERTLRPFVILRPYNAELITCSVIAFSPIVTDIPEPSQLNFWFFFAGLTLVLSAINFIRYNRI